MTPDGLERTALKEWAVLVDAMARGEIFVMVRKGGIREKRREFEVRHDRFLLYPTFFHENPDELAERLRPTLGAAHGRQPAAGTVRITHAAEVAAVWSVTQLDLLPAIAETHGLAPKAVEARFTYRNRPGVHVVAIRVRMLPEPAEIPEAHRYTGCVSWLELDQGIDVSQSVQVIPEPELQRSLDSLRTLLGDAQ